LGAVIVVTAFLFADFSQAQTIVSEDENTNIVRMVFDFEDDEAQKLADDLLIKWQEGMDAVWNNNTDTNIGGTIYGFELIKMEPYQECADYPEYHCIGVVSSEKNQRGNIADVNFNFPNSGYNSTGEWTTRASGKVAAHEVGHMMGLLDEYHYEYIDGEKKWINDNNKESEEQSIMAQTWGPVTVFSDQINKILKSAGIV
jgi:hypothetical protein